MFKKIHRWARYKRLKMIRSYKLKHTLPKYTHCKNCETKLEGMYCHKCGQYALDTKQNFWKFISEYFSNTYQTDGRALTTLWLLISYPGFLSLQFVKGRVASYVHPMKLYLFCSIVFFALVFILIPSRAELINEAVKFESSGAVPTDSIKKDALTLKIAQEIVEDVESREKVDTATINDVKDAGASSLASKARNDQYKETMVFQTVIDTLKQYLPLIMLLCLPFYGMVLRAFFRKSYRNFMPHYVFAIHSSIFMMILMLIAGYTAYYVNYPGTIALVSLTIFTAYTVISIRNFYQNNWFLTILKSGFVLFIYTTICILIMSILLIIALVYNLNDISSSLD